MTKSAFTQTHAVLVQVLIKARRDSGLLQAELAQRVGKDQSFVSRLENGQRRVDMVEFLELAEALERDPHSLFAEFMTALARQGIVRMLT